MQSINYIQHLNGFFIKTTNDSRLNATHISLYMALFYYWNLARFPAEFFINRNEVMTRARIGSKGTYHKCLKDLHKWKYLHYKPSHNPTIGSKIHMFNFGTTTVQVPNSTCTKSETSTEQVSGPYINMYKQYKHENIYINKESILNFFKKNKWPKSQANKFFNHYESINWKKGTNPITNWKAAAELWMIQYHEKNENANTAKSLHASINKNYNEPL